MKFQVSTTIKLESGLSVTYPYQGTLEEGAIEAEQVTRIAIRGTNFTADHLRTEDVLASPQGKLFAADAEPPESRSSRGRAYRRAVDALVGARMRIGKSHESALDTAHLTVDAVLCSPRTKTQEGIVDRLEIHERRAIGDALADFGIHCTGLGNAATAYDARVFMESALMRHLGEDGDGAAEKVADFERAEPIIHPTLWVPLAINKLFEDEGLRVAILGEWREAAGLPEPVPGPVPADPAEAARAKATLERWLREARGLTEKNASKSATAFMADASLPDPKRDPVGWLTGAVRQIVGADPATECPEAFEIAGAFTRKDAGDGVTAWTGSGGAK